MKRWKLWTGALALAALALPGGAVAQTLVKLKAGMVTGIDQVGLPIALERGFFEKHGLDVTIARPYATGVDALNALQAGESEIVQVGVPMIGAVLRGMDLVALGNYSGNATKLGSDATVALVAREGSGIDPKNLATLKGKKIAASFGTINHLYALALIEKAGLTPADVTLVNTPPPDMTVALLSKGVTSCGVRPAFSSSASAYRWLIVPNEAAIFLPLRLFRSPLAMPVPAPAIIARVASEPALAALPV